MVELTEDQKWSALHKTALADHGPICRYGQTNGREMCTCQVLVDIVEGTDDHALARLEDDGGSVAEPKPDRMAAARAARARNVAQRRRERAERASS